MYNKVLDFIKKNRMIEKGDRIVIGVSGGADSVCLLYVLHRLSQELDFELVAVHVNHGIRGMEAERDSQFVNQLCERLGIELCIYTYDVKKLAKDEGFSEEEAGRKARYGAFYEVCSLKNCNKIAVAHNKNDNAETILFHLFRGSGIKGLSGIDSMRRMSGDMGEFTIIRPLINLQRKDIEEFLLQEGITYQIDSTNLTEDYSRNKIRRNILSYVEKEINSGAVDNITGAALQLKEIGDLLEYNISLRFEALVERAQDSAYRIKVKELTKEHIVIQKGIVLNILEKLSGRRKDIEAAHVLAVIELCNKQVGKCVHLPYRIMAEREYEQLKLYVKERERTEETASENSFVRELLIPGKTLLPTYNKMIETEIIDYKNNTMIPKSSCVKWFDYDKIENALEIRSRREGDYIQINALGGNKKLKDYLIDRKIPRKQRDSLLLIADGSHIMWIPGEGDRISEKYKVETTTTRILVIKMFDLEEK